MRPRFAAIDGLRGLAIALVTVFHMRGWLPAGGVVGTWFDLRACGVWGVSLFFALSGFCLYYPLAAASAAGRPWPSWRTFFRRRATRILPAYLVSVGVWLAIWSGTPYWPCEHAPFHEWPSHLLRHLTFTHTFWPDSLFSMNPVLWSLGVEVHFYLLFPLLAVVCRRRPWGFAAAAWVVMNALRLWLYLKVPDSLHVARSLPGHLGEFAGGMLAGHLLAAGGAGNRWARLAVPSTIGLLVVPVLHRWTVAALPAGQTADFPALGLFTPLLVVLIGAAASREQGLLTWRPLTLLGLISYSVYLYNLLPAVLTRWWAPYGFVSWWLTMGSGLLGASVLSYWVIERPFLRRLARPAAPPPKQPPPLPQAAPLGR